MTAPTKYFGWYDVSSAQLLDTHSSTNLYRARNSPATAAWQRYARAARARPYHLLHRPAERHRLDAARRLWTRWANALPLHQELYANGTILGFNLGDELVWNCVLTEQVQTAAATVRKDFPRGGAIIWYNEAAMLNSRTTNATPPTSASM